MFDIHFSNRIEVLTTLLVARIGQRTASVFDQDLVLIPSAAMRRHLSLKLADDHGICANVQFTYLAQWLWHQVAAFDPTVARQSPFDPGVLTWHVYAAFCDLKFIAEHPRLASYLGQADELMRHELAVQVAGVLSHYITYRNDWLEAWQRGEPANLNIDPHPPDAAWQGALWLRIVNRLGVSGPNPLLAFAERLASSPPNARLPLPAQAHVFCLPDIAPLHLQVLRALGRHMTLHLYTLNPSREFWFDVVDPRRLAYLRALGKGEHLEVGNRLLASWGKQNQSQLSLLVDALDTEIQDATFIASPQGHLLGKLQGAMLELAELQHGAVRLEKTDRSIECHVCHSRSRELEVLHDRLLALFKANPDLHPGDVLVVTPDLAAAAPLIDAVFGSTPRSRAIPYEVSGLGRSRLNPVARALLDLLALAGSRWRLSEVQAFIEQSPVSRRLDLDSSALEQVRQWLTSAGVHWGINAAHRAELSLPAFERHSFEDGLNRLFLAYALPATNPMPFNGRLPADANPEGSRALLLGALWRFLERLVRFREQSRVAASSEQWARLLTEALNDFVEPDANAPEDLQDVLSAIGRFVEQSQHGLDDMALPLDVVVASLTALLDEPAQGGLPSGSVTFTSLSSLRNLPYRVVCLVGFDDTAFPKLARPPEFDLMARHFRPGDRQRQADDRSLFLDHLLAAREVLHISYVGRSIRDNAVLPPSVLVSELLDTLIPVIAPLPHTPESLAHARARLLVEHPLQPFSRRAFSNQGDPRIRSFNQEFASALARQTSSPEAIRIEAEHPVDDNPYDETNEAPPSAGLFFSEPLSEPDGDNRVITLTQLIRFLRNPCQFLLDQRLGIATHQWDDTPEDDEPLLVSGIARKALSSRLMHRLIDGAPLEQVRELALAGIEWPSGSMGRHALDRALEEMQAVASRVRALQSEPPLPPYSVQLQLSASGQSWTLSASFSDLRPQGLIRGHDGEAGAFNYLEAWLHFLVLSAAQPANVTPGVTWVHSDTEISFHPCHDPLSLLADLVGLFANGLREPLYFFPKSAWAFMHSGGKRSDAAKAWQVTDRNTWSESSKPAYRLALRGKPDPMGEGFPAFERCARAVFEPLQKHLRHP